MRCPECSQRNSVAASKCKFCGGKIKKKGLSISLKAVAIISVVVLIGGVAAAIVPSFQNRAIDLSKLGDRMAQGPKSVDDAERMKNDLDRALLEYLRVNGGLPSADLLTRLQSELPTSTFEVLVFDLPRNIKLVEVDCVLQPSDYLVVPAKGGPKPYRIDGLSVFDEARLVSQNKKDLLLLLGHTTGGGPANPQLKLLDLQPEAVVEDVTHKLSPPLFGEGTIKFEEKSDNLRLNRTLISTARGEGVFAEETVLPEESFSTRLIWKEGRLQPRHNFGNTEAVALYAVATSISRTKGKILDHFSPYISNSAAKSIENIVTRPLGDSPKFAVSLVKSETGSGASKNSGRKTNIVSDSNRSYRLDTEGRSFEVSLLKAGKKGPYWSCNALKEVEPPAVKKSSGLANGNSDTESKEHRKEAQNGPVENLKANIDSAGSARAATTLTGSGSLSGSPFNKNKVDANNNQSAAQSESARKDQEARKKEAARIQAEKIVAEKLAAEKKVAERKAAEKREIERIEAERKLAKKLEEQKKENERKQEAAKLASAAAKEKTSDSFSSAGSLAVIGGGNGAVNIRSGPGTKFSTVTTATAGSKVKVIGKKDGWYQVSSGGKTGYVYGGLVEYQKPDGYTTAVVKQKREVKERIGGGTSVSTANPGDKVVVVGGLQDNKYKVRLSNGKLGFVDKEAIDVAVEEPAFVP